MCCELFARGWMFHLFFSFRMRVLMRFIAGAGGGLAGVGWRERLYIGRD